MWYGGGQPWSHSTLVIVRSTDITSRFAANASQMIKRKIITAISEIREPMDETVFHRV